MTDRPPLRSGDWDNELLDYWRRLGLSAHNLWIAEMKMHLFGRKRAYDYLDAEATEPVTSGCTQIAMWG
jgi:hypothetical protein